MSELTIIIITGLAGLLQAICLFILTHVINKLEKISDKQDKVSERMGEYVKTEFCTGEMCKHYEEIQNMWKEIRKNTETISALKEHHK